MNEEELGAMPLGSTIYEEGVHPWVRDVRSGGWVYGQGTPNLVWNTSKTMSKRNCTRDPKDLIDEGRPSTTDDKIRAAIKVECDRQHVGVDRQKMLYRAYTAVMPNGMIPLSDSRLRAIAGTIEEDNGGYYRTTPVSFNGIVGGVPPENIELSMSAWIEWFNSMCSWARQGGALSDKGIELVIKEFLDIHPFSDGNGRTAWLLRVWLLNQWNDPQPLPDYYKEA